MRIFEILLQDVAAAARTLRRSPGFAVAATATLALGIGANTAIFSLINATLIAPLPYPDADRLGPDFAAPPRENIGVVKDVRDLGMDKEPIPMIYIPQAQVPNGMTAIDASILPITWAVRTVSEPYSFRAAIQGALKDASGGLAVARIRSMEDVVSQSTARSDLNTVLLAVFAAASLLLAAVGIYGLIVFSVQQRTHEIGIRLALGATRNQVRHLVLSQGVPLAVAGVILGALASLELARYMQTLVYGVKPVDAGTILISSLTLGSVAAFACYIPAHRASRLDPATVLRST